MSEFHFPRVLIADGTPLSVGPGHGRAVTEADDEDWADCLFRARQRFTDGAAVLDDVLDERCPHPGGTQEAIEWRPTVVRKMTLAETLAHWAAHYLARGVHGQEDKMGRTPDEKAWAKQRARWIEMAERSAALAVVLQEQRANTAP